jgi:ribosomal protein S20
MPIIKSAKKRVRTARKATIRNSKTKRGLRSSLKLFAKKITSTSHSNAQSAIDTAIKKGLMSKNKAARMKRQLSAKAKTAGVKPTSTAKSTAKPVAKKVSTTKKPLVKKAATKKSAVKKAAPKKKA